MKEGEGREAEKEGEVTSWGGVKRSERWVGG